MKKRKPIIKIGCFLLGIILAIVAVAFYVRQQTEPMYYHRDGLYEITPDGTVTLLTEEPISTVEDGVLYSLFENSQSFGMTRNGHTYLEIEFYYPENDAAHRPQLSPCGSSNLLTYANYGKGAKLFYPVLSLEDEQTHLLFMDDDFDSSGLLDEFAVHNTFLAAYEDKLFFLLKLEDGTYPARLDWEVGEGPRAVQLSDMSANINGLCWVARDRFWWVHHDQETGIASLCYVPLSGGETTVIEIPEGYSVSYVSEDHVYYHLDGELQVYDFRGKTTTAYPAFSDYDQICAATQWGALVSGDGESYWLLRHDSGEIVALDMDVANTEG